MRNDILPTGAYLIRNKSTSKVLHIPKPDVATIVGHPLLAHDRDEIKWRDQQIWWVERLPEDEQGDIAVEAELEAVYSITNTASGLSVEVGGESLEQGARIGVFGAHGGYNQRWKLKRAPNAPEPNQW